MNDIRPYKHIVLSETQNCKSAEIYRVTKNGKTTFNIYKNVTDSSIKRIKRFFPDFYVERQDDDGWIKKRGINHPFSFVETHPLYKKTYTVHVYR